MNKDDLQTLIDLPSGTTVFTVTASNFPCLVEVCTTDFLIALATELRDRRAKQSLIPSILSLIIAHQTGDNKRFESYARFIAEKANDERFTKYVENALRGESGAIVYPMENAKEAGKL